MSTRRWSAPFLLVFLPLSLVLVSVAAPARADAVPAASLSPPSLSTLNASALAPVNLLLMEGARGVDEHWYMRNRRFALVGKVLTVVGVFAGVLLGTTTDRPYWGMTAVGMAGALMWSGSDLRATNELRAHGYTLRRGAAIAAVIGAVIFQPMTWIAGPIQSARIRNAGPDAFAVAPARGGLVLHF